MRAIVAFLALIGVAGFASGAEFVFKSKMADTTSAQCGVCQITMAQMQEFLKKDHMQTELRSVAQLACSQLPITVQSTCLAYVNAHYQKVIDYVLQHEVSTVCSKLNQCGATSKAVTPADTRSLLAAFDKVKLGADECAICKAFFTVFIQYVTDPSFISSVVNIVTSDVCPRVSKEFPECSDFATRYIPLVFSLLQQVSADAVCGFVKVCPSGKATVAKSVAVQDDCSDCTTFVTDVQQRFSDPAQQQQLTDAVVNQVCPLLSTVFPQCGVYAQEYVPIGLQMFEGLSPSSVCQTIGWCGGSTVRSAVTLFHTLVKLVNEHAQQIKKVATPTSDPCADCQAFVTDAQKRYADPAQQQVVIDLVVNQACPLLSVVFPQCADYAKEYIPIGFTYLEGFNPQQVCQQTGFCSSVSKTPLPFHAVVKAKRVGDACSDCTTFIGEAQTFYSDPTNQQQFTDLVTNTLCPLAESVFPECVQFAQAELPIVFAAITQVDPNTICNYIGLCGGFFRALRSQKAKQPNDLCGDCQTFFTDFQQYYSDPNNQQRATDELVNEVCPLVSQQFPECSQILPEYLPVVFEAFEGLDPSTICSALNMCNAGKGSLTSVISKVLHAVISSRKGSSSLCTDCNLVVEVLRGVVASDETVTEIIATLTKGCNIVAEAGRPMCAAMLNAVVREFIYTFKQASNTQVCATFFSQCAQTQSLKH